MPKVIINDAKGLVQQAGSGVDFKSALRLDIQSVTATDDGTGTGVIAASPSMVVVDADGDANHIVTLPAPVAGTMLTIYVGATGCELQSSAPATVGINGVTGAGVELAIPAQGIVQCVCTSATNWAAQLGATATPGA